MGESLAGALVAQEGSIRDAMRALDLGAGGIALAVDTDGRLVGIATDGDIRRALLDGATLDSPVDGVLNRSFVALQPGQSRIDALDLMRARHIDAIPLLDDLGRPAALHLLHAFLEPGSRPNWAVVMAGGEGTRLRPLTDVDPQADAARGRAPHPRADRPAPRRVRDHPHLPLGALPRRCHRGPFRRRQRPRRLDRIPARGPAARDGRRPGPAARAAGPAAPAPQRRHRDLDRYRRPPRLPRGAAGTPRPSGRGATSTRSRSAAWNGTATGSSASRRNLPCPAR